MDFAFAEKMGKSPENRKFEILQDEQHVNREDSFGRHVTSDVKTGPEFMRFFVSGNTFQPIPQTNIPVTIQSAISLPHPSDT